MKYFLSSYNLGDKAKEYKEMIGNRKVAFIPNAVDYIEDADYNRNVYLLTDLGIETEILDLKKYFGKENELYEKLKEFGGVMVSGGNTYVLRQAMHLSGFDNIIKKLDDFIYAGWSAGVCVLAPSLEGLQQVDDPTQNPYNTDLIMEGLNILDYLVLPHYKSDHPESADIDKEVEYCTKNNIKFKTMKDGEVIIL
ncbi:MAG: Type 1 glutamine amidotransferase-like domain-containing protein [archaeon]